MNYSEVTPYIKKLAALSDAENHISYDMYAQFDVKRGLCKAFYRFRQNGVTQFAFETDKASFEYECEWRKLC